MSRYKTILWILGLMYMFSIVGGCKKTLIRTNQNPNGASLESANPALVLSYVLTQNAQIYNDLGFGDLMGVMQYTAKDGWASAYNNYRWDGDNPWNNLYHTLKNNEYVYERAVQEGNELVKGISLVMRAEMFGLLADQYGAIPYEDALKGDAETGGTERTFPTYTDQETVYMEVLENLKEANIILSKPQSEYFQLVTNGDTYFNGSAAKWRKAANSLALRYYMRLSEKLPQIAKEGIEEIAADPSQFPVMESNADDMISDYARFKTTITNDPDQTNYRRVKLGGFFGELLSKFQDPRAEKWVKKVEIFLHYLPNSSASEGYITDTVVDGENKKVRYVVSSELLSKGYSVNSINQDPNYVGIPVGVGAPQTYNMYSGGEQAAENPHVSWLAEVYKKTTSAPIETAKVMTAAEVHFIFSEAKAVKNWTNKDAEEEYYRGIEESFNTWDTKGYSDYITLPDVVYDPSKAQDQIVTQKYIHNWSSAQEAWFDWRRTGIPDLHGGSGANASTLAPELPLRFYYPKDEQQLNFENMSKAAELMEKTQYSSSGETGYDFNSPWTKMWLIQGTGKPY